MRGGNVLRMPVLWVIATGLVAVAFGFVGVFRSSEYSPAPPSPARLQVTAQVVGGLTRALGKHEPENGCILGAFIDLDPTLKEVHRDLNDRPRKLPHEFESVIGKRHGMYFFYMGYGRRPPVDWIRHLAKEDRIVHIAMEPNDGLDVVQDDGYLRGVADELASTGAKIICRFGSEMNGTWTVYNKDPKKFIEKFRLVTQVFRERAPNVAMLWCPYATPVSNIMAYYPGDEWVDWVGVNMYNVTYFDQDKGKPAMHVKPRDMLKFVYEEFAGRKPIMIGEYGTTHYSAVEKRKVVKYAVANIRSLYTELQNEFIEVKGVNYFNCNNLLVEHRKNNNYLVQTEPEILKTYRAAIAPSHFVTRASDIPWRPVAYYESPILDNTVFSRRTLIRLNCPRAATWEVSIDGARQDLRLPGREASWSFDPKQYADGSHTLEIKARDASGGVAAVYRRQIVIKSAIRS